MIPNMTDQQLLEKLLKSSIEYMQINDCEEIVDEAKGAIKNIKHLQDVCKKVSNLEEKQPTESDSATSFIKDMCKFLVKKLSSYIPLRFKITAIKRSLAEFFKNGKKLPEDLKPKIKEMEHYLQNVEIMLKAIDSLIADINEKLKLFVAREEKTLSDKDYLKMRRNDVEAELKKCENYCDAVKKALVGLKEEIDDHVKLYTAAHCAGAIVLTLAATALSGGLAAVGGAAAYLALGASATGLGATGLASGSWTGIQVWRRKRSLATTFNRLEAELGKIKELYEEKAVEGNKLVKNIDDMLNSSSNQLFSYADAL